MPLIHAVVAARINETAENYARADRLLTAAPVVDAGTPPGTLAYDGDAQFWEAIFADQRRFLNKTFTFHDVVLSEWVPRVPGLAHRPESRQLFEMTAERASELGPKLVDGMRVYQPAVKSAHVLSGVGTLRLPPNTNGEWLFSISANGDASYGVPVLVRPDVWDHVQRNNSCEGRVISGRARWQPMDSAWSAHFRSTGSIPAGYFVLNDPDALDVEEEPTRTWVYPFTIMEYQSSSSELFDYVYCGAHTDEDDFRIGLEQFFEQYRLQFGGAHSRFLIAGDLVEELWEAQFNSPADLLTQDSSARSQLELLQERVKERMIGKAVIDELLQKMEIILSEDDLIRVADEVGVASRFWRKAGTSLAEQYSQFLAAVITAKKEDSLIERLAVHHPAIFA